MLQEVRDLQNKAVFELCSKIKEKDILTFKAPTGSGKTFMIADFMDRILAENPKVVFLVSALSKSGLASQNYEKFCEYVEKGYFSNIKPYLISSEESSEGSLFIPEDYNVYILPRDLYKKDSILKRGAFEGFLKNMTTSTFFCGLGKTIYLIKDEAHIKTENIDSIQKYFSKTINVSATPKTFVDVEITEEEALNVGLIKSIEFGKDEDTCAVAINKFEEIKKQYRNLLGVNPCLIMQVSNENKGERELAEIKEELSRHNLCWMYIETNEKKCETNDDIAKQLPKGEWKNYVKDKLNRIDVVIFKMVITEGFDIPRACMLYQSRVSRSKALNEQVMGRVRRNPRLLDFEKLSFEAKTLALTSWIWGNATKLKLQNFNVKLCADGLEIQNEIRLKTTVLKSLEEKKDFDIQKFLEERKEEITSGNIFELYKKLKKSDESLNELCHKFSSDYSRWFKFTSNLDAISNEFKNFVCNYDESMEIEKDEVGKEKVISVPLNSSYFDNKNYVNISNWIWKRKDGKDKFSFDSEAERAFASILQNLVGSNNTIKKVTLGKISNGVEKLSFLDDLESQQKYLWGKNYLQNSEIKFEYYLNGIHSSYPDFIMKDSYNRFHLFEVKSVNSGKFDIDREEYIRKVQELEKCYLQASKLTGYLFYIPKLENDVWQIKRFKNGEEETLSEEMFIHSVKNL